MPTGFAALVYLAWSKYRVSRCPDEKPIRGRVGIHPQHWRHHIYQYANRGTVAFTSRMVLLFSKRRDRRGLRVTEWEGFSTRRGTPVAGDFQKGTETLIHQGIQM